MTIIPPFFLDNPPGVFKEKGVYCTDCHKTCTDPFEARDTQGQCVKCHGDYDALIKGAGKSSYGTTRYGAKAP